MRLYVCAYINTYSLIELMLVSTLKDKVFKSQMVYIGCSDIGDLPSTTITIGSHPEIIVCTFSTPEYDVSAKRHPDRWEALRRLLHDGGACISFFLNSEPPDEGVEDEKETCQELG